MADKITGVTGSIPQSPARQKPADESGRAAAQQGSQVQSGSDSVELTDSARRLNDLTEQVAAGEVADANRIDAVRQAIEDGSYQVDAERLASKVVAFNRLFED